MSARRCCLLSLALVAAAAVPAPGQAPAVPPNPEAPTLGIPMPLGVQRGVPLDLTLTGGNLAGPTGLWTSFPAKVTIPADKNNGKDNGSLRVRLDVPKDAPLGYGVIRLATARGMSNLRIVCVDDLPQLVEVPTNRSKAAPQPLPTPCVVAGRIDAEQSSYFRITVKPGQRLSFEIIGRRLGSPLDPQITIIDPRSHHEIAFSNDAPGLQTDPRLTHTFREPGDYLIEVRDVEWRGGGDYVYRLRIGDFPCATTPVPLAAKRGTRVKVGFAGPAVDGVAPVEVIVPNDPALDTLWVAPRGANGLHGWPVALAVSDFDQVVEQEPNNEPAKATRVPAPGGVTGRLQDKGDVDYFVFKGQKGKRLTIEAHTHELYSPTEVYMVLKDAKGGQLAATNPAAEPRLDFTPPTDADYYLSVEHVNYWGGPEETYWVTIQPPADGFDVALGTDRFDLPQGGVGVLPINTITRRGYNGPIEVSVTGDPALSGRAVLLPAPPVPNQPAGLLFVQARPDAPIGPATFRVLARATAGKAEPAYASTRALISQEMAGLQFPPRGLLHQATVAVKPKAPFTIALKPDHPEGVRGVAYPVTVVVTRAAGFTEEIALAPLGLPPTIAPALKNVPKGKSEVKVQLTPAAAAPLAEFALSVTGKAKFQGKDYQVIAAPLHLTLGLPFDLKVEPATVSLKPGAKVKVKVAATRKGGYQGPISLQFRGLPPSVTAGKGTIAAGQAATEVELTAAASAAAMTKAGVNVLGTATAAGNQQKASGNFTVAVAKK